MCRCQAEPGEAGLSCGLQQSTRQTPGLTRLCDGTEPVCGPEFNSPRNEAAAPEKMGETKWTLPFVCKSKLGINASHNHQSQLGDKEVYSILVGTEC